MTGTMEGRTEGTRADSGFTLLELIVALTLMTLMAVALWAVFSISLRSWSTGTNRIEVSGRHRYVMDATRKQIASAYPVGAPGNVTNAGGVPPAAEQGASAPLFFGSRDSLVFVSLNSRRFFESPGLTLAAYRAVPDEEGTLALVTGERPYTGGDADPEALPEGNPLFEGLAECIFEYFDPGTEPGAARWVPEWDGSAAGTLPAAVRLTLVSPDSGSERLERQMVIPIRARDTITAPVVLNPFAEGGLRGRRGAMQGGPRGGTQGGQRGMMRGAMPKGAPEGTPEGRRGGRREMGGRP